MFDWDTSGGIIQKLMETDCWTCIAVAAVVGSSFQDIR